MKHLGHYIIPLILLLSVQDVAMASCAPPLPPEQNVRHSAAVFTGEVVHVGKGNMVTDMLGWRYPVTFKVLESWKGVTHTTVVLKGQAWTSIEFLFEQGQHYLVYAYHEGNTPTGPLTTNGCKGTKRLADAQADLKALGGGTIALQPAVMTRSGRIIPYLLGALGLLALGGIGIRWRRQQRA
jgi:hypothetical protein